MTRMFAKRPEAARQNTNDSWGKSHWGLSAATSWGVPSRESQSSVPNEPHFTELARTIRVFSPPKAAPMQRTATMNVRSDPLEKVANQGAQHVGAMPIEEDSNHVAMGPQTRPIANATMDLGSIPITAPNRGLGAPLPSSLLRKFGVSLGADLNGVRVHTSAASAAAAKQVSARAFTIGQNIHFASGEYNPQSAIGQQLLAHEVAHTVQQRDATWMPSSPAMSRVGDASEVEADRAAHAIVRGERAAVSSTHAHIARDFHGIPDAGAPEIPFPNEKTVVTTNPETKLFDSSKRNPLELETLGPGQSVKLTHDAGNYYRVMTANGKMGYVLKSDIHIITPAEQAPKAPSTFQPIIDKALKGPVAVDNEQAWLLDGRFWMDLLTSIPNEQRDLRSLPIGGLKGWLHTKGKPVVVDKFGSIADGPNNTGLISFQGNYLLWRHALHHNHNPKGGSENIGDFDAIEGYKLPIDILAKYEAKMKAKKAVKPK